MLGIIDHHRQMVAGILMKVLADETVLCMKTKNAHWNVEGPDFGDKHLFFERQFGQMDEMIDSVAERIRIIGHYAPATLTKYLQLTHLTEQTREKNTGEGFIQLLLADHESIIIHLRENIETIGNDYKDNGTADFITQLLQTHERMAWFLRSHLPA